MPERGAQVEIPVRGTTEHERATNVDQESCDTDAEHGTRIEILRVAEPANRFDPDTDCTAEEQQTVDLGGEHLGALEAVGVALRGRPLRQGQRTQCEPEREHVGGEMDRVGDERQAPEQEPAHELDDEQHRVRGEGEYERSATRSKGGIDRINLRR